MPSRTLASRVRTGAGASVGQISSKTAPAHSGVGSRQGSYEHRGRHKSIKGAAPETAQYAGDQGLQTPSTPTETMKVLGPLPVRRAWRVRPGRASPDISQAPVLEAVMLHERGDLQGSGDQCSKCRRGDGISPECVKMPGINNGACSNCLLARTSDRPGSSARPVRSYSAERRSISATISPSIPKEDLIAVWNLIAGVIATQPQECFTEDGSEPPGKKIEDAARLVARSADEWGHTIKEEESDPGKTPKSPSERSRLVRQATRIRETALQIANCARIWGEKLERKRSSSQLRRFITGFPASDQDDGREMRGKDGVMGRNVGHLSEPLVTSTGCNARRPPSNPQEVSPSPVPPRYTGTRHKVRRSEGHRRCEGSISGLNANRSLCATSEDSSRRGPTSTKISIMTASGQQIEVLLYGLGAIGSFYAFILSRVPRVRLTVVARSNYNAVKENGIAIASENHGEHNVRPYRVVRNAAEAEAKFDYIVCAHKAITQDAVPAEIAPAVDAEKSTIVIIQNGVGNEVPFRKAFPHTTIISCVTWTGAAQPQPGHIKHTKSEDMQIGLYPNDTDQAVEKQRLDEFASLLTEGKTVFQVVPNIQVQRWEKVVWNAAWNSLTTLTLLDTHSWLSSSPDATPMTQRLMREVIDVAKACEVPIDYDLVDKLINKILAMHPIGSSMQNDFKAGRPMEVDIILGYPYRKGKELGIATPTLDTIYVILTGTNLRLLRESGH
ncbi:2-dehydropantoate 2-reductase [Colletotrichum nymphaeae SA-01]|uniref:2-dehydropantoate 2-reductase n=1 Tax=Colletotrichum nymphaeae SA-01 TaxID=1460502 RepID=A0A135TSK9_9PEZI|nr:2-dehydropantoate 2-reductase [Colletotrichum nymphaeae SA-01]